MVTSRGSTKTLLDAFDFQLSLNLLNGVWYKVQEKGSILKFQFGKLQ